MKAQSSKGKANSADNGLKQKKAGIPPHFPEWTILRDFKRCLKGVLEDILDVFTGLADSFEEESLKNA